MWNLAWERRNRVALFLVQIWLLPYEAGASDRGALSASGQPVEAGLERTMVLAAFPMAAAQPAASGAQFQERLLLVDVNRQRLNETVLVLEDAGGVLYLSGQDMQRWRLRLPDISSAIEYQGEKFYPLTAIAGLSQVLDLGKLTLAIVAPPEAFAETTRVARYAAIPAPVSSGPGGFVNYDLFAARSPDSTQRSGQFELGYFNRFGVGTGNVLARDLGSNTRLTRLDTTWTVDYPEDARSLRLGDAINRPGTWGRSVRYGGIQYGSNFATQPGFVTFPLQSVVGQAVLPSTVDVFVNNALVARQSVPPGPFSINDLPVVTGTGEVRLVVRDLLGREQLITRPFYAGQSLLREGLEDFSYEFGFVRENFGINSFDYGSWLATGTYRRGMSERLTGELRAEAMQDQATAGGGGDYVVPRVGTISGYAAASHGPSGNGWLMLLGIDRQARPWTLGARTQRASSDFTQIGQLASQLPPAQLSSFNLSYAAGAGGSIGIAYVTQRNRDQSDVRIATLSYSVSLGRWASFSVSAVRSLVDDRSTAIFAMLSVPLDSSTSASFSSQSVRGGRAGNRDDFAATLQRNLPLGEGYGYRVLARSDGSGEGTYTLQNNIGTYTLGIAQSSGATSTRLEASGGVALLGGDAFLGRRIDQSFAVVRIPDYPNVRILADNQPAGRTDARGDALIPRLRAYDNNVISIDQRDLPLDAEIGTLNLKVVPYLRSGVEVTFPIRRSRGATLTIHLDDGTPLPVGATVTVVGRNESHVVGYDGEVYVIGLGPANSLRANWRGKSCEFDVPFAAGTDPLPHLGTFVCKGVQP